MKFKFALIKNTQTKKDGKPCWLCYVDNYLMASEVAKIKNKELMEAYYTIKQRTSDGKAWGHFFTYPQKVIGALFVTDRHHTTVVQDIELINKVCIEPLIQNAIKGEVWLINTNWGMMPLTDDIEIVELCERDKFIFPARGEDDIRIIKWDNGKHYYAKIGNIDVMVDGKQKWNTRKRAKEMARKFLKENGDSL